MTEFSPDQVDSALAQLHAFEARYVADPHSNLNPFSRPGLEAATVAAALELWKEGTTKAGRQRVDAAAARRLLRDLIARNLVESTGHHRTLSEGSKHVECFAPFGFMARRKALLEARRITVEEN